MIASFYLFCLITQRRMLEFDGIKTVHILRFMR